MEKDVPLMPDKIRDTVAIIKENNNLDGLTTKDLVLYLTHKVEKIEDAYGEVSKQVSINTNSIKWLDRGFCGTIIAIIGFFITVLYFFMGV